MKIEKTQFQEVRTSDLLEKLKGGWTPVHSGWVQELVLRWAALLDADLESEQADEAIKEMRRAVEKEMKEGGDDNG